jgi:hypothetical protein
MSDEEKNAGEGGTATAPASEPPEQPFLDEHTTEPNAPQAKPAEQQTAPGKWQMPAPKFQQSSGYLPQGYLKDIKPPAAKGFAGSEDTTQEQAPYVPSPPRQDGAAAKIPLAIEPQPDLDQLIPDEPIVESAEGEVQVKTGSGFPMIVFGLIGIVIFVVAFLVAVYFLFLANPSSGNNF